MKRVSMLAMCALLSLAKSAVAGEVTFDGSLGTAGAATKYYDANGYTYHYIPSSRGVISGGNLFHSFGKFGISLSETAWFTGPSSINNIISRVTGGTASYIDGTIWSSISGANLYLLNPAGIVFGPHASLNVSGSFHASTADYLKLGDSARFYADTVNTSNLVSVNPTAFGFLDDTPGLIGILGSGSTLAASVLPQYGINGNGLTVPTGKTLSFVGGLIMAMEGNFANSPDLPVSGRLQAPGGNIMMASVGGPGEVAISANDLTLGANQAGGYVWIESGTLLDVQAFVGGNIVMRGENVVMTGGSRILAESSGGSGTGLVDVYAREGIFVAEETQIGASLGIMMHGNTISIEGGSKIRTVTSNGVNSGLSGSIFLSGDESVRIVGSGPNFGSTTIYSATFGSGNAGLIQISAPTIDILDGAVVTSVTAGSTGDAGNVYLIADVVNMAGNSVYGTAGSGSKVGSLSKDSLGRSGDVVIITGELNMEDGASVSTSTLNGGDAGNIRIFASESVSLSGSSSTIMKAGSTISAASVGGQGTPGDIYISTKSLYASDGGVITSLSSEGLGGAITIVAEDLVSLEGYVVSGSGIINSGINTEGSGDNPVSDDLALRGDINITTKKLVMSNGAVITSSLNGSGKAGDIVINASESIALSQENEVFTMISSYISGSYGQGGDITLTAPIVSLTNGAAILANTLGDADGGNITINASNALLLEGTDWRSDISSEALSVDGNASGNSGDIRIRTGVLGVFGGGRIGVGTNGNGMGGNLDVIAEDMVLLSGGSMEATVMKSGTGGNISVASPLLLAEKGGGILATARENSLGGNVFVIADQVVMRTEGYIAAESWENGIGGYILVNADDVTVQGLARISATNYGSGIGGYLWINGENVVVEDLGFISGSSFGAGSGGLVRIDAGSMIVRDTGFVSVATSGSGDGGVLLLNAGYLGVEGGHVFASSFGAGRGGDILVVSDVVSLEDGGQISASAENTGAGGNLVINAQRLGISNAGSMLKVDAKGSGAGGFIGVTVGDAVLSDGGVISAVSSGSGDGGDIRIAADRLLITDYSSSVKADNSGAGAGGSIDVSAREVWLLDGGNMSASTSGSGRGGNITIAAGEQFVMKDLLSSIISSAHAGGDGGTITISAPFLEVGEFSFISANSFGSGDGGHVRLAATDTLFIGGALTVGSAMMGTGNAGSIILNAPSVIIGQDGSIDASTQGVGLAGNIEVSGRNLSIYGKISSLTRGAADGGSIFVSADETLFLQGRLEASATSVGNWWQVGDVTGDAGDIRVKAPLIVVLGSIDTSNSGWGGGGSIDVEAGGGLLVVGSIKGEVSGAGRGGEIRLGASSIIITGDVSSSTLQGSTGKGGDISMTASSSLRLWGGNVSSNTSGSGDGGNIDISTGKLVMEDMSGEGAGITAGTYSSGNAGSVRIRSVAGLEISAGSGIGASAYGGSIGKGGSILISTPGSLVMWGGSAITVDAFGSGDGGNLSIDAGGALILKGSATGLFGESSGAGDAGNITVSASGIILADGAQVSTSGSGSGQAGNIVLHARGEFLLTGGGEISSSNTGSGRAGSILVASGEKVTMLGSMVNTDALLADGGNITILAPTLLMSGSQVSAKVSGGTGKGGDIRIAAGNLGMSNSRIESSTSGRGDGGSIHITAQQTTLAGGSEISANSALAEAGAGRAGSIYLRSVDSLRMWDSTISTQASAGAGGDITVLVDNLINLTSSSITTSVLGGAGNGGNIFIDPIYFILQKSRISADAIGGSGGNIRIIARTLLKDSESSITASSSLGIQGTIDIDSPEVNVAEGLMTVSTHFFDASALIGQRCAARSGSGSSSFVIGGRGGVPAMAGDLMASGNAAESASLAANGGDGGWTTFQDGSGGGECFM